MRRPFRAGLHVAHYFLLGGPGETGETLDETLTYIDKLEKIRSTSFLRNEDLPPYGPFSACAGRRKDRASRNLLEPVFYESSDITNDEIIRRVKQKAGGRVNWVVGSGGEETSRLLSRMYERGRTGPLWEYLIR